MKAATCLFLASAMLALDGHADSRLEPLIDTGAMAAAGRPPDATHARRVVAHATVPGAPRGAGTYHAVTGDDFQMAASDAEYRSDGTSYLYCSTGEATRIASAVIHVPAGRSPTWLDMWGHDNSAADVVSASLYSTCHASDGPDDPQNTVLATVTSAGQSGPFFADEPVLGYHADPAHCTYSINVQLGTAGTCEGTALVLYKVRVAWN
jgi:hypothetical protein